MVFFQRICNVLFILVLCGVLAASFSYEFAKREEPCPLCFLQRLSAIAIALSLMMNLRFGIKEEHYGLAILGALFGSLVSLRQIALHVCPQFPTFGEPVFGFDLYVWALIVYGCALFACAVLMIIHGYSKHLEHSSSWGLLEKFTFWIICLMIAGNIIVSLKDCALSACTG